MKILTGYAMGCYNISKLFHYINSIYALTAEVEVDGGGDLAKLVLGAHLVQPGVALDHIVDLQHHQEAPE